VLNFLFELLFVILCTFVYFESDVLDEPYSEI